MASRLFIANRMVNPSLPNPIFAIFIQLAMQVQGRIPSVLCGEHFTLLIHESGGECKVKCWGSNKQGQLGLRNKKGKEGGVVTIPGVKTSAGTTAAVGKQHTLILIDGQVHRSVGLSSSRISQLLKMIFFLFYTAWEIPKAVSLVIRNPTG